MQRKVNKVMKITSNVIHTSIKKKQLQKIEKKIGMEYQKAYMYVYTNKGSKDGNKGQESSLLLCVLSLWLFIC